MLFPFYAINLGYVQNLKAATVYFFRNPYSYTFGAICAARALCAAQKYTTSASRHFLRFSVIFRLIIIVFHLVTEFVITF